MRILVLGGGGREHAIVHKLAESPKADQISSLPATAVPTPSPRTSSSMQKTVQPLPPSLATTIRACCDRA